MLSKECLRRVQQDDKFLSKENSVANPSFRVYYGVAPGAVPFLWESQPGTPKHAASDAPLPPLTPPPAYFSSPARPSHCCSKKPSRSSLIIDTLLPKLSLRKSTSASSLASSPAASSGSTARRGRPASPMSSYSSRGEDEESDDVSSPTSTLCFGRRRSTRAAGGLKGRHSITPMKSPLLSIVHGHHGS